MNRRGFLTGALGFLAAPAIVRAGSLMPVSVLPVETRGILPLPYRSAVFTTAWVRQNILPGLYNADLTDYNAWLDQRAEAMKLFGVKAD